MDTATQKSLSVAQKLLVCAAVVCAIGAAIVAFGGHEAQADITALDWLPHSKHQRFIDTLRREGMSRPRSYDWNGNKVFFSTKTTDDSPMQVLRRFQDAFVREGINQKTYLRAPLGAQMTAGPKAFREGSDAYKELIDGAMIPMETSKNRVVMTGVELAGDATMEEVLGTVLTERERLPEMVEQLRYVEAYRAGERGRTTINAVWSDDELDMRQFGPNPPMNESVFGLPADMDVPVCPGCERKRRFAGEQTEEGFVETIVVGPLTTRSAYDFYLRELTRRGWQTSASQRLLAKVQQKGLGPNRNELFLSFARADERLQVLIYREPGARQTTIHLMRSP